MRLYTIYKICKENIGSLKMENFSLKYENSNSNLYVQNWNQTYATLKNIYVIEGFQDTIDNILNEIPVECKYKDSWMLDYSKRNTRSRVEALRNKMQGIIDVYESFGYTQEEIGIDIKMPEGDFGDFVDNIKTLEYIFMQCPTLKIEDGSIKFNNVDVGSTWLTFFIVGAGAIALVTNIATLVDKAIIIRSHRLQTKQQEEQLRTLELANDVVEDIKKNYKVISDAYMKKALDELQTEDIIYKDGEERDKTKMALERMIELLDKGMEIYSSIDAPKEIQTLFPPLEAQKLITEDEMKMLSMKDKEE